MKLDLHKFASLMVRDSTIMAKQLRDASRSYSAIAETWRLLLAEPATTGVTSGWKSHLPTIGLVAVWGSGSVHFGISHDSLKAGS